MTREELIANLEHLAEYVKYSEDAPALREVIEMLKCSEMPNSSEERTQKCTETHACDLIQRETARRIIGSPRSKEQMLRMLEATPPAQHDHSADVSKMVNGDAVSRQAVRQKLTALVNELEEIFSDIRERNVDDSVCGLCEYDGAYIGQSGDWCNECPGFDRDDCFKLKEKYREEWLKIDG